MSLSLTARSATLDGYEWYYLRPIPVTDGPRLEAFNVNGLDSVIVLLSYLGRF